MSLLHISINASNPEHVAEFLARILGGRAMPFPPFPDCWIAFAKADDGTAIEVYPATHVLSAGTEQIACTVGAADLSQTFVHAAIASPLSRQEIMGAAQQEGWLSRICNRGPFECVEIWLEGRLLVEVLDPAMQADYHQGMTAGNWAGMFGFD